MQANSSRVVTRIEANPLLSRTSTEFVKKKVAAYCRVSTDSEDQLNSYEAQIAYYTEAIAKNPNWTFAGIYADEGITGTATTKRKDFLRLMRDCEKGKVDFILTKSVSRFARNTVDSLMWTRKLRAKGIGVYFEEQAPRFTFAFLSIQLLRNVFCKRTSPIYFSFVNIRCICSGSHCSFPE